MNGMRIHNSVATTLFLVFFFSFSYFYPGGGHNEAARYDTIRALINDGSFIVDKYAYNSADLINVKGHYYSSKAPGTTFLGLPFFWATEKILSLTPLTDPVRDHWVCYWTSVFAVALPCAFGLVVLFWLLLKFKASEREAAVITIAVGLGTIYFPFATIFFSHSATGALLITGFYQIFSYRKEKWRLVVAGFALGFAIIFEFPAAIAAAFIGLYAIWRLRKEPRGIAILVVTGFVGLVPLFLQNWIAFGSPFILSYSAYAQDSNQVFEAHKQGVLGIKIPLFNADDWRLFLNNMAEITYRPLRGIFIFNPVLLYLIPGFFWLGWKMIKRRQEFALEMLVMMVITISYFAMNAGFGDSIVYWGGGASFGPRHIIPALPFMAPLLLEGWRKPRIQAAFVPALLVSIFFCIMATSIEPRTPYAPNNAIFQYYLPKFLKSEFAITTVGIFSEVKLTENSIAFNWGKLAGLPPSTQLIPLLIFWVIAARNLDRLVGVKSHGFTYAAGIMAALLALIPIVAGL